MEPGEPTLPDARNLPTATPAGPPPSPEPVDVPAEVLAAPASARFGPFILVSMLGRGGMGEVWKAWDSVLTRWVALKFLKSPDPGEAGDLLQEARMAARLSHPNLGAIYEVRADGPRPYIAMQFVDGTTLLKTPREDLRTIARLVRDAARAVDAAHASGMVHRDLKPQNLMVERRVRKGTARFDPKAPPDERVFVMDFGLARVTKDPSQGGIAGTPGYMPPEQARGQRAVPRSDVYALGATLYHLISGRPPHRGSDWRETLRRTIEEDPPPLRSLAPQVDVELEAVVHRCLEKNLRRRYDDAAALADDLDRWLDGDPVEARRSGRLYRLRRKIVRHKAVSTALAAATLALGVAASWPSAARALEQRRLRIEREERLADSASRVALAEKALESGRAEEAASLADVVITRRDPAEAHPRGPALLIRGRAAASRGRPADAVRDLVEAVTVGTGGDPAARAAASRALFELGRVIESGGDASRAERIYRAYLARNQGSSQAREATSRLAALRSAASDFDDAHALHLAAGDTAAAAALEDFLPSNEGPAAGPEAAIADVDGDGMADLVFHEPGGRVSTWSLRGGALAQVGAGEQNPDMVDHVPGRIHVMDVLEAPGPEIITTWGTSDRGGGLTLWRLEGGIPRKAAFISIPSTVSALAASDLDGDGRREFLIGIGHSPREELNTVTRLLQVYRFAPDGTPSRIADLLPIGRPTDILHAVAEGSEVTLSLGPWNGWMLWKGRWNATTSRLDELARSSERTTCESILVLPGGAAIGAVHPGALRDAEGRRRAGIRDEDLLPAGLHGLAGANPGGPRLLLPAEEDEEVEPKTAVTLRSRRGLQVAWLELRRRENGSTCAARISGWPPGPSAPRDLHPIRDLQSLAAGDLDGDGDDELLLLYPRYGRTWMRVLGLGNRRARPVPTQEATVPSESAGMLLLDAGLETEAETEFRTKKDEIGLGLLLLRRGRPREAVEVLAAAGPARRTEALRLLADGLQELRDWEGLEPVLRDLVERPDLGPAERERHRGRLAWVDDARRLAARDDLKSLHEHPGFGTLNPFLPEVTKDGLVFRQVAEGDYEAGLPFRYPGGRLRLEADFRVDRLQWGTKANFGMSGPDELFFSVGAFGSSSHPDIYVGLQSATAEGSSSALLPRDPGRGFRPEPGSTYRVAIDYVPGDGRAVAEVFLDGRRLVELTIRVRGSLRTGWYRVGKPGPGGRCGSIDPPGLLRLSNLRLGSADPAARFEVGPRTSARDLLMAANGAYVRREFEQASSLWTRAIEVGRRSDPAATAGALLFRGWALGDSTDVAEATKSDPETAQTLLDVTGAFRPRTPDSR